VPRIEFYAQLGRSTSPPSSPPPHPPLFLGGSAPRKRGKGKDKGGTKQI